MYNGKGNTESYVEDKIVWSLELKGFYHFVFLIIRIGFTEL